MSQRSLALSCTPAERAVRPQQRQPICYKQHCSWPVDQQEHTDNHRAVHTFTHHRHTIIINHPMSAIASTPPAPRPTRAAERGSTAPPIKAVATPHHPKSHPSHSISTICPAPQQGDRKESTASLAKAVATPRHPISRPSHSICIIASSAPRPPGRQ
jgi:hypothetical protein